MATWSELKFKLIATGDETGTWGDTTNENLGTAIEQAITGSTDITFLDDNVTLVLADTTALQQARALRLNLVGGVTASKYLQVPDIQKYYIISNTLTENIVIQNSTGTDYTVPAGTTAQVFSTGTGIKNALSFFSGAILSPAAIIGGGTIDDTAIGLTTPNTGTFTTLESTSLETTTITGLTTPLSVGQGGTGVALSTGTTKVVLSDSPTLTGSPLAPTAAFGTNTTQIATTAFVQAAIPSGGIIIWSGSSASIPSGWRLCDGTNSTPDLRDRFVVGAGSTYAVGATGGSANAVLVSHTHTATSTVTDPSHNHVVWGDTGSNGGGFDGTGDRNQTTDNAFTGITVSTSISTEGVSGTNANLPPYYALCYIMKS